MKLFLKENVLEAALKRIRFIFDEFPNVVVGVSGGKDSTIVYNLALQVAREKQRLPLTVMFLDQEAEWEATIDTVRAIMSEPDVRARWYQIPFQLFNATSATEHWLKCWAPEDEERWMRPHEPEAITENVYGTERFGQMFTAIMREEYKGQKACYLAGVRAEESPGRKLGVIWDACYKWITWGRALATGQEHFTFYPIYDWTYGDVWSAIHKNGWPYNAIYDAQYAYGVPVQNMRVSNVHHETAVHSLFYMQEFEPKTYARLTQRIAGVDMAGKLGKADYWPTRLPPMFESWREYRDYLLEKLITSPDWVARFKKAFARHDLMFAEAVGDRLYQLHIASILTNDWEMIKLKNWETAPDQIKLKALYRSRMMAAEDAAMITTEDGVESE